MPQTLCIISKHPVLSSTLLAMMYNGFLCLLVLHNLFKHDFTIRGRPFQLKYKTAFKKIALSENPSKRKAISTQTNATKMHKNCIINGKSLNSNTLITKTFWRTINSDYQGCTIMNLCKTMICLLFAVLLFNDLAIKRRDSRLNPNHRLFSFSTR